MHRTVLSRDATPTVRNSLASVVGPIKISPFFFFRIRFREATSRKAAIVPLQHGLSWPHSLSHRRGARVGGSAAARRQASALNAAQINAAYVAAKGFTTV